MPKAGFGKTCITPPPGAPLAGFAARKGNCAGTHDDLYARALVLGDDASAAALVSVDVLGIDSEFVARVRNATAARVPIAPDAILIACTHTHAAPTTIATFFNPDESVDQKYMDRLARAIEDAIASAWEHRFEARIGVGAGRIEGLGVNRRSSDGRPVDEEIGIIKVAGDDGVTRGVLFNYGCHPTVLGPDNLLATGDFPAMAVSRIEERLGAGSFAMFVNGAEGDISVGHSSELSAIGVIAPGRTFERASEIGGRLGDAVLSALDGIETDSRVELGAYSATLNLPLKRYPAGEETARALREAEAKVARLEPDAADFRRAKSELLYASIEDYYARVTARFKDGAMPIELQAIRVQDAVFVAVPGEVFVEIGLRVKRAAPCRTFLVGLANGYVGYLPARRAYEAGGYEVVSARCTSEVEDRLVQTLIELEKRLIPS